MAINHAEAVRNGIADYVVGLIDTGTGSPNLGTLVIATSASPEVEVATLTFANPAFGDAAAGVATANAITSDTSATGGTAGRFQIKDSDGTFLVGGAVSTSGSDINLSSVAIGSGDTVSISSLTYTAPT